MKIGDKVSYPMHGAGEIIGIEESEVGGEKQSYYIMLLPMGSMRLMLPVDKVEEIGVRDIIDKSQIDLVAEVLSGESDDAVGSWNKRFHTIVERMKTGNILEVAAVVRNISRQYKRRKIPTGEKRLMDLSRQILISELVYVLDRTPEEVTDWVDSYIEPPPNEIL